MGMRDPNSSQKDMSSQKEKNLMNFWTPMDNTKDLKLSGQKQKNKIPRSNSKKISNS